MPESTLNLVSRMMTWLKTLLFTPQESVRSARDTLLRQQSSSAHRLPMAQTRRGVRVEVRNRRAPLLQPPTEPVITSVPACVDALVRAYLPPPEECTRAAAMLTKEAAR